MYQTLVSAWLRHFYSHNYVKTTLKAREGADSTVKGKFKNEKKEEKKRKQKKRKQKFHTK